MNITTHDIIPALYRNGEAIFHGLTEHVTGPITPDSGFSLEYIHQLRRGESSTRDQYKGGLERNVMIPIYTQSQNIISDFDALKRISTVEDYDLQMYFTQTADMAMFILSGMMVENGFSTAAQLPVYETSQQCEDFLPRRSKSLQAYFTGMYNTINGKSVYPVPMLNEIKELEKHLELMQSNNSKFE